VYVRYLNLVNLYPLIKYFQSGVNMNKSSFASSFFITVIDSFGVRFFS